MLSVRLELTSLAAAVFETAVYTIPPQERKPLSFVILLI